jgi:putative DNA primase/helicase
VQHRDGGEFLDAVQTLSGERARREISGQEALARIMERARQSREQEEQHRRENEVKTEYALRIWNEGTCIWDTPAQTYLASRRCDGLFPPDRDAVFRFHQRCRFGDQYLPCLLTLLRNIETDAPQAVHRTALTPDGKKIDRKMLGPKAGAAIKLWPQSCLSDRLVVGEGIETTLSAALHVRHRDQALVPAWAAIDAGNLAGLPVLAGVRQLTILVDADEGGTGQEKAKECSHRWVTAGREVRRLTPRTKGDDFNDVIRRS